MRRGQLRVRSRPLEIRSLALTILVIVAVAAVLRYARGLFLPIVLAVLLQFVLEPVVRVLRRLKIPAGAAAAMVLLSLLGISGYGVYRVYTPALEWFKQMPESLRKVEARIGTLKRPVEQVTRATEQVEEIASLPGSEDDPIVRLEPPGLARSVFSSLGELIAGLVLGLALAYFLLANKGVFLNRIAAMLTGVSEKAVAADGMRKIESQISKYLLTVTLINAGLGIVVGLIMMLTGMPNPVLWGAMAGVLVFVPYLGPTVGVCIVAIVSLVTFDDLGKAILPPLLYTIAAVLEGMIITPMVLGIRLTLSPVAIFIWLVFMYWLWGIPGAVIAVPILVILKILCDNMRSLEPIGRLLER
jgi:predicted PurR-regulated permease PerM